MAETKKLKQLIAQRSTEIIKLNELRKMADLSLLDKSYHNNFKCRAKVMDDCYETFQKLHTQILSLVCNQDDGDTETQNEVFTEFQNNYFECQAIFIQIFEDPKNVSVGSLDTTGAGCHSKHPNVKLPKLDLPRFEGDLKTWQTFKDMFDSLIHHNDTLTNVEKFNYLLSCLKNTPLTLVRCNPLTSQNYIVAYNALNKKYSNKRLIASSHWHTIENTKKLSSSDSSQGFSTFLNIFEENVSVLENQGYPVKQWDFILFTMLFDRLDSDTATRFELEHGASLPDEKYYTTLINFLNKQCSALDNVYSNTGTGKKVEVSKLKASSSGHVSKQRVSSFVIDSHSKSQCQLCKNDHTIYNCPGFLSKTPNERFTLTKNNKWSTNCLGTRHGAMQCNSTVRCAKCSGKHHSLLHMEKKVGFAHGDLSPIPSISAAAGQSHTEPASVSNDSVNNSSSTNLFSDFNSTVLLSTALIEIQDKVGNYQTVRVILDSASQSNCITRKCVNRLGLSQKNTVVSISGIGRLNTQSSKGVTCTIKSRLKDEPKFDLECVVLPKICSNMPNKDIPDSHFSRFSTLELADPKFNVSGPVDMLLGADISGFILTGMSLSTSVHEPIALETIFGWVIMGKIYCSLSTPPITNTFLTTSSSSLESTIKQFWELEQVPTASPLSSEEIRAENHFQSTFSRTETGRYIVELPFKTTGITFEGSRTVALRRFLSTERRLAKNPQLHSQYNDFMREYISSGHMERVPDDQIHNSSYYIPHLCVMKPDSSTTKLRVVFDASAQAQNNIALNDTLLTGPKLQRDIVSILLRFRLPAIVFTSDVKNMYRQILVSKKHVDFQRILWRFSPSEPILEFRLLTLVYGLSSSPFQAIRTLLQLSTDYASLYPQASRVIKTYVYMDDVVTGENSLPQALSLQKELISLLKKGGFELRKWASSDPALLAHLPPESLQLNPLTFDSESKSTVKILGLQWDPSSDSFSFHVNPISTSCTKRTILSELARVFDPLGLLAPLTLSLKIIIQQLWALGLDWDETPPESILQIWNQIKKDLSSLSTLRIPRFVSSTSLSLVEIHGFSDASKKGYAGAAYIRYRDKSGIIITHLLCAKAKVAPLKKISIPKLELCGALLTAKLLNFVHNTLKEKLSFTEIFAWTDSSIVLSWLNGSPHRWNTFVCNRVTQINELLSSSCWHHVSSAENSADPASRGLTPLDLLDNQLWWAGPHFLRLPSSCWYLNESVPPETNEEKRTILFTASDGEHPFSHLLTRVSSLMKIQRIVSYMLRFIHLLKKPECRKQELLSSFELESSLLCLIKYAQECSFSKEITLLKQQKPLLKGFRKLSPFLDEQGILRVGGRLARSSLPFEQKHPVLLPNDHRLTSLIIEFTHTKFLHPGILTLHNLLCQRYWILSPRRTIRKVVASCHRCFRVKPVSVQPPMGDLPPARISQMKPFAHVGVDMAGPFSTKLGKIRGAKTFKSYVCIFVCMATKAKHIELVSELTTEAFLASLRRFIARRGRCNHIYSDCGSNFIGSSKYFEDIMTSASAEEQIKFHFNPAYAPNFGGLWESGVKSMKSHLIRVVGEQILTFEEFYTVLVQIEAVLNSRPLSPASSDPNDIQVLTPGHFLTMEPLNALPDPDLGNIKLGRLSRWQLLQSMHQSFWQKWHRDYLHTLLQKSKWTDPCTNIEPNSVVVLKEDNLPPLKWHYGRVEKVFKGMDGVARVIAVKTSKGVLKRPVSKLRFLMKIHAFVRSNAPKVLKWNRHEEKASDLPKFTTFLYFLYAPTMIYRDEYPRADKIRRSFVLCRIIEMTVLTVFVALCFVDGFIPMVQNFCTRKYRPTEIFLLCLQAGIIGAWVTWAIQVIICHSVQNIVGELLSFGDRSFYSDWWTCCNYKEFFRKWNLVVGDWLYLYIFDDMYKYIAPGRQNCAKLITFFISIMIHEWMLLMFTGIILPICGLLFLWGCLVSIFLPNPKNEYCNIIFFFNKFLGMGLIFTLISLEHHARVNLKVSSVEILPVMFTNCTIW